MTEPQPLDDAPDLEIQYRALVLQNTKITKRRDELVAENQNAQTELAHLQAVTGALQPLMQEIVSLMKSSQPLLGYIGMDLSAMQAILDAGADDDKEYRESDSKADAQALMDSMSPFMEKMLDGKSPLSAAERAKLQYLWGNLKLAYKEHYPDEPGPDSKRAMR